MSFDVASVKPARQGTPPGVKLENGRVTANLTLSGYIVFAWNLMPTREQTDSMLAHVPKWVSTDNFAIEAVAAGTPAKDQMRLMVRSLLADRFQLQVHTVTTEAAVIALTSARPGETGPKLRPHSEGQPCNVHLPSPKSGVYDVGVFPPTCEELLAVPRDHGVVMVAGRDLTIQKIATFLSSLGLLTRPVVDQTRFSGHFDFTIEFTPEPPAPTQDALPGDIPATTLEEAVHEQLGLKLKPTRAPLDTLVVDHAERPLEN